jgi:hypothetical protein
VSHPIDTAHVEIVPDVDRFAAQLKRELDRALKGLAGNLDKSLGDVDRSFKRSGENIRDTIGKGSRQAGQSVDALAQRVRAMGGDVDQALAHTRQQVATLAREFARTGDVNLFGKLGDERGLLSRLNQVKADLSAGEKAATGLAASLSEALSSLTSFGPEVIAGIAGALAVAAPTIGAGIAAAVSAAVGTVGIVGGITLAARDPRVKAAGIDLGQRLLAGLTDAAQAFVPAVLDALDRLNHGFRAILPDLRGVFDAVAPLVPLLAEALVGLIRNVLPGIRKLAESLGPLFGALEGSLARFGQKLATMFRLFAAAGPGATRFLVQALDLAGTLAVAFGAVVLALSKIYEWTIRIGAALGPLAGILGPLFDQIEQGSRGVSGSLIRMRTHLGDLTGDAAKSLDGFAGAAARSVHQVVALQDSIRRLVDEQLGLTTAAIDFEAALDDLTESVRENGKSLDIHGEQGRANARALLDGVRAAEQLREATSGITVSADEANRVFAAQIEQLRKQAIAAGLSAAEVDKLIASYKKIPTSVHTTIEAQTEGATNALQRYLGLINGIPTYKVTSVEIRPRPGGPAVASARQHGGPVKAGELYKVGERGPEWFVPSQDGMIATQQQLRRQINSLRRQVDAITGNGSLAAAAPAAGGGNTYITVEGVQVTFTGTVVPTADEARRLGAVAAETIAERLVARNVKTLVRSL